MATISHRDEPWQSVDIRSVLGPRLRSPAGIVLGSPRVVAQLVERLGIGEIVCYQMDLHQADRLREELQARNLPATAQTAPDLWDLPADFQTLVYPAAWGAERGLKLDMVEQAFHVLRHHGILAVLSPYESDQFFTAPMKKLFGKVHVSAAPPGTVLWGQRDKDRPRRRHEVTFQATVGEQTSLRFVTRPGVFTYGRLDDGARALIETMTVRPGDRVLDLGCGCGTNGIFAGLRAGPEGHVTFVDSNLRAVALAELNARANGLTDFAAVATGRVEGLAEGSFDVVLANPPYHAQQAIARLFIERARALLKPGGRLYFVTKQADQVGPFLAEVFGPTEVVERRGYAVLCAEAPRKGARP